MIAATPPKTRVTRLHRRRFRRLICFGAVLALACALAQSQSTAALERARQAKSVSEVYAALGAPATPLAGNRLLLEAPDIAISGRPVLIKLTSRLPGTDLIALVDERADPALILMEEFSPGLDLSLESSITLKRTSRVRALVRAGGKFYEVSREIKVATPEGRK